MRKYRIGALIPTASAVALPSRLDPSSAISIGQMRAQAVLQALKIQGVKDGQMETVSWGLERPKASGHAEAAWAENRRVDLVDPKP